MDYAREHNGRKEHLTANRKTTLCGKDTKMMAKYDRQYGDSKSRPMCPGCRSELDKSRKHQFESGKGE